MLKKLHWNFLIFAAIVSYPFVIHYLVLNEYFQQASFYILTLVFLLVLQNIIQGHKWLAAILIVLTFIFGITLWLDSQMVVFLPPILIPLALAYLFGKTLIGNNTAFITVLAQKIRNTDLDEREIKYTRKVTWLWFAFFIITIIEDILLAYFTDVATWSYVTNFVNYILVTGLFIIEYSVRRIVLSELEHPGFISFVKKLIRAQYRI